MAATQSDPEAAIGQKNLLRLRAVSSAVQMSQIEVTHNCKSGIRAGFLFWLNCEAVCHPKQQQYQIE
jgi:hypothetical protein